jgi:hypothetical protein
MLLDDLERHVLAERQVVAIHNASGRYEERPLPTFHEARDRFDAALVEEPKAAQIDSEEMQLRRALGVA